MGIKAISLKERTNPLVTKSIFDLHGNQGEIRITISSAGVTAVYESKSPGGINEEVRECCIPMDHNDVFRRRRPGQKTVEKAASGTGPSFSRETPLDQFGRGKYLPEPARA